MPASNLWLAASTCFLLISDWTFATDKFSFAKSIFKYPLTTNRETSFCAFSRSSLLDSIPSWACLYEFKFLNPLNIVPFTPRLNRPLKLVVFFNTPVWSGDSPELIPPLELAPMVGRKFPWVMATSLSEREILSALCLIEMLFSSA